MLGAVGLDSGEGQKGGLASERTPELFVCGVNSKPLRNPSAKCGNLFRKQSSVDLYANHLVIAAAGIFTVH